VEGRGLAEIRLRERESAGVGAGRDGHRTAYPNGKNAFEYGATRTASSPASLHRVLVSMPKGDTDKRL
jgi:hypothetical protein